MNNYFRDILISENDKDASFISLVRVVLLLSTVALTIIAIVLALTLKNSTLWRTVAVIFTMAILSGISLFLTYRNILWVGKALLPVTLLVGITFSAINANGLRDSAIVGFTFVIVITTLITGQKAIPLATFLTLLGVWTVAYADITFSMVQKSTITDIAVISLIQIVTAFSLNGLMTRLNSALEASQSNEQILEHRITDRTKALTTVSEISTAASTILDTDILLLQVVDLAKERFNLYHAHIYLLNEAGDALVLSSGAGEVGRQMVAEGRSIPLDREQSLVARAAREKKGVTVNDVTKAPDFLPNPLLPNTRAELAVPMLVGEQVIGVFDVQSEVVGRFTDADIAIQTTLASQVASAIQNSRSFTKIQHGQTLLAEALKISRLGNWEYDVEKDLFTFNDQFYSIFHTTAAKVGGYKLSSADYARNFVHADDAILVGSEIQKALESKERYFSTALEHRIIFEDGETGYISVKLNVERDENGRIIRWYGANQDISERRRVEELNRKRATEQETINQITQKIQNTTTIESALQIAVRELGHLFGKKPTVVSLGLEDITTRETSSQAISRLGQN